MQLSKIAIIFILSGVMIFGNVYSQRKIKNIDSENTINFISDIKIDFNQKAIPSKDITDSQKNNQNSIIVVKEAHQDLSNSSIDKLSPLQFKYGILLKTEVENINNKLLYEFIEQWLHTRYQYGGTTKNGVDCSGFCGILQKNVFNILVPRTASEQYKICESVSKDNMQEGDLVFFNTSGGISHVGVYLHNGYFVHASVNEGVTISNLAEDYYNRRYVSGGRIMNKSN
jgi:lipoprotein Spr